METRREGIQKRILALLCAAAMVLGLMPIQVLAETLGGAEAAEVKYVDDAWDLTVEAEVEDETAITWSSTPDTVLSVTGSGTEATVTALDAGDATVTASAAGTTLQTWSYTVKERSVTINGIENGNTYCVATDTAPTITAALEGVESVTWSVTDNTDHETTAMSINASTGAVTFGSLTGDSVMVKITATAVGYSDIKDTKTITLTKGETDITFVTGGITYGKQTLEATVTCGGEAVEDAVVAFEIVGDPAPTYATISGSELTMTDTEAVTIKASYAGNDKYKACDAQKVFTATAKQLSLTLDGAFSVTKTHDGTTNLTEANKTAIRNALNEALFSELAFENDAVTLSVGFSGAAYNSADIYDASNITGITVSLTGEKASCYVVPGSITIPATISAKAPVRAEFDLTAAEEVTLDGVTISGAKKGADDTYWVKNDSTLSVTGVSAKAYEKSSKTEITEFTVSESTNGTEFYIAKAEDGKEIFYGPYSLTVQVDAAAPTFDLAGVSEMLFGHGEESIYTYTVTLSDEDSGVDAASVRYAVMDSETTTPGDADWQNARAVKSGDVWTVKLNVPASGYLYLKAADCTGNEGSSSCICAVVLEDDKPTVEVTGASGEDLSAYTQTHTLNVSATDAASEGTAPYAYSGIREVTYKLYRSSDMASADKTPVKEGKAALADGTESRAFPTAMAQIPAVRTFDGTITFTEADGLTGDYTLCVTAVDFCGNESEEKQCTLHFDNTSPLLTVTGTAGNYYEDGDYFNDTFTVTFTITDDQPLDTTRLTPTVSAPDGVADVAFTAWTLSDDERTCTATVTVENTAGDGHYQFSVSGTDVAGNALAQAAGANTGCNALSGESGSLTTRVKVLDTKAPVAAVSVTAGNYFSEADYLKDAFSVTFTVTDEELLDAGKLIAGVSEQPDGGVAQFGSSTVDAAGKTYTIAAAVAKEAGDGHYCFGISGTDRAGNALIAVAGATDQNELTAQDNTLYTRTKVLDTKAPELTVAFSAGGNVYNTDTEQADYLNKGFTVTMTVTDEETLDVAGMTPQLTEKPESSAVSFGAGSLDSAEKKYTVAAEVAKEAGDGHYQFSISGTDKAGNALVQAAGGNTGYNALSGESGSFTTRVKVLDTHNPTFTLNISSPNATNPELQEGRYYFNSDFTVQLRVEDTNIDDSLLYFERGSVLEEKADFSTAEVAAYRTAAQVVSGEATDTVSSDGLYRYRVYGADKAGNPLLPAEGNSELEGTMSVSGVDTEADTSRYVVRDTVAPTGELTVSTKTGEEPYYQLQWNADGVGNVLKSQPYRTEKQASVVITGEDHSPIKLSAGTLVVVDAEKNSASRMIDLKNADFTAAASGITLGSNTVERAVKFMVSGISVIDRAGNEAVVTIGHGDGADSDQTNMIYLDNALPTEDDAAPNIDITFITETDKSTATNKHGAAGTPLYSGDVELKLEIVDPNEKAQNGKTISSGLGEIYYRVLVDGTAISLEDGLYLGAVNSDSEKRTLREAEETAWENSGYEDVALTYTYAPEGAAIKIPASLCNRNNIEVEVVASDNAGNVRVTKSAVFGIDATSPEIQVVFDNNSAANGKYFKENRNATVKVYERNFDPTLIKITTEINVSGAMAAEAWKDGTWKYTASTEGNGDRDCWEYTIAYNRDGDYKLSMEGMDAVGNAIAAAAVQYITLTGGAATAPQDFVIDKTAPVLSVRYDTSAARNEKYFNTNRTATLSVNDDNFDGQNDITVSATRGGTAPGVSFSGATATLPFTQDGNYQISGSVTDMAGNVSNSLSEAEFVVDKTAPVVTISGVVDQSANNGTVAPVIAFSDFNFDTNGTEITLVGANSGAVEYPGSTTSAEDGRTFYYSDFAYEQEVDDIYTLAVSIVDLAGNEADSSIMFSANRFGSVYTFDTDTESMRGKYIQMERDVVLTETNVDSLQRDTITVKLTHNGVPKDLREGTDYKVAASGGGGQWSQYIYTLDKALIAEEGVYAVAVYSVDAAGNINENIDETKKAELNFGVDKTAPVVLPVDFESNTQYAVNGRTVDVEIKDNLALGEVTVLLNGEKISYTTVGEMYSFTVPESNRKQSVTISATDEAGNVCQVDVTGFLVSTNLLARWYNNTALFAGSIAFVAVAGAGGTVMLVRKKRGE